MSGFPEMPVSSLVTKWSLLVFFLRRRGTKGRKLKKKIVIMTKLVFFF